VPSKKHELWPPIKPTTYRSLQKSDVGSILQSKETVVGVEVQANIECGCASFSRA
jgi:hypothetical protein